MVLSGLLIDLVLAAQRIRKQRNDRHQATPGTGVMWEAFFETSSELHVACQAEPRFRMVGRHL